MNRHRKPAPRFVTYAWFQFLVGLLVTSAVLWGIVILTIVSHGSNLFIL